MKLVSLNIWGGRAYNPFMEFVKEYSQDVDIFCFQEVFSSPAEIKISRDTQVNILGDLTEALKDYKLFFGPEQDGFDNVGPVSFEVTVGLATFVRESIHVYSWDHVFIHGERNSAKSNMTSFPASMLCTRISAQDRNYSICNVYGYAYPGNKLDTPERLEQSQKAKEFLDKENGSKILCGDFNLMPETESIKMLEENMENLIKSFGITNTRSRISPYFGTPEEQKFADYCLVSPEVKVKDFQVLDTAVSDHLPMILEFESPAR